MSAHPYRYSMVLDDVPAHPYQVESLLLTLQNCGAAPREALVVQCTDRVDAAVKDELAANGYTVVVIEPYLDKKYCNKIVQLDCFAGLEPSAEGASPTADAQGSAGVSAVAGGAFPCKKDGLEGVFLFDSDTVVLSPLDVPDRERIWGKIVDHRNPPLATLRSVFSAMGVALPRIVPCDWDAGDTIETNFNGGLLYIPMRVLGDLRTAWRRWAELLFDHTELFPERAQVDHIDQISFAMALASEGFSYGHLPANWNYPCHEKRPTPLSFDRNQQIRLLHYHQCLDAFGLIMPSVSDDAACEAAAKRANTVIGGSDGSMFFDHYKRGMAASAAATVPAMRTSFAGARTGERRRLILHGGTPKTGTSALQWCLDANRNLLEERGFWYPPPSSRREPKHQALVAALLADDETRFAEYVDSVSSDAPPETHTVILSTEGIFNHWWDYSPAARGLLRGLADEFDFELCVWFRDPASFAAALYAQYLRNPVTDGAPDVYGRDIDFRDAMQDAWFRRHLDYLGFYYEAQALFGRERVRAFLFGGDTVGAFEEAYGTGALSRENLPRNDSMREAGVRMMRIANRYPMTPGEHERIEELVFGIDRTISDRSSRFVLNRADRETVQKYAGRGWEVLRATL